MKLKEKEEALKEKQDSSLYMYNPEKSLRQMISFTHGMLEKIFIFFMGILPGMSLLHLFLLNQGKSDSLRSYSQDCLRINQLIHVTSMIACVGSVYLYVVTNRQCTLAIIR